MRRKKESHYQNVIKHKPLTEFKDEKTTEEVKEDE